MAEAEDCEGDSARARLHVPSVQDERAARRAVHHWPFDELRAINRAALRHPTDPLDQSRRRRAVPTRRLVVESMIESLNC